MNVAVRSYVQVAAGTVPTESISTSLGLQLPGGPRN
jgi:hypothetical protein